eukprot:3190641-Amphidinium_carterae.1
MVLFGQVFAECGSPATAITFAVLLAILHMGAMLLMTYVACSDRACEQPLLVFACTCFVHAGSLDSFHTVCALLLLEPTYIFKMCAKPLCRILAVQLCETPMDVQLIRSHPSSFAVAVTPKGDQCQIKRRHRSSTLLLRLHCCRGPWATRLSHAEGPSTIAQNVAV